MKLKLDENGHVVVVDGKPVYTHSDGKDVPFDAVATVNKISALNSEAKTHREAKEAAEAKLAGFEGIEDPAAAKQALETVKNLKDGDLVKAGQVEEIKRAAIAASEEKIKAQATAHANELKTVKEERDGLKTNLDNEVIGGNFTRSKFIGEKIAVPSDLIQSMFGRNYKVEDGKPVAYDASGNKIYSRSRPGEVANFDESLEVLVDQYPNRDHILKGSGANGDDGKGSNGGDGKGGGGGGKTMKRAAFDALSPAEKHKAMITDRVAVVD